MLAIHMLMGMDQDRFRSTIEDFECAYPMDKENRYPKTLHDWYTLLKGWKGAKHEAESYVPGVSFNSVGDETSNEGSALVNNRRKYKGPTCSCCGWKNHLVEKCIAKKHENGTLLYVDGETPID
jgi:hypothetical protein